MSDLETSTGMNVSLASFHWIADCRPSRLQGMGGRWAKKGSKNPDGVGYKQQKLSVAGKGIQFPSIAQRMETGSEDMWKQGKLKSQSTAQSMP